MTLGLQNQYSIVKACFHTLFINLYISDMSYLPFDCVVAARSTVTADCTDTLTH